MSSKNTKPLPVYLDRIAHALEAQGVSLKRAQLLEVCAGAFGYRNSNELTAAGKTGELVPYHAEPVGTLTLPDGQRIVVLKDVLANAPYAIDEAFLEHVVAEERREMIGVTPYGHLADLKLAVDTPLSDLGSTASQSSAAAPSGIVTVYMAMIEHKHGEDHYSSETVDGLYAELAGYVRESWNEVAEYADEGEGPDSGQTDRELVSTYFDLCANHELRQYYSTWTEEVEMPGISSSSSNETGNSTHPAYGRNLLGYQIADASGRNIQGDDDCPGGHASYEILSLTRAQQILAGLPEGGRGYLLQPIYRGTIEGATFVDAESTSHSATLSEDLIRIADELESGPGADIWYDAHDYGDDDKAEEIEGLQMAMIDAARILRLRAADDQSAYEAQIGELHKRIDTLETERAELNDILERTKRLDAQQDPLSDQALDLLKRAYTVEATRDGDTYDLTFLVKEGEDPEIEGVFLAAKGFSLDGLHAMHDLDDDDEDIADRLRADMDTCDISPATISLGLIGAAQALNRSDASAVVRSHVLLAARNLGIGAAQPDAGTDASNQE